MYMRIDQWIPSLLLAMTIATLTISTAIAQLQPLGLGPGKFEGGFGGGGMDREGGMVDKSGMSIQVQLSGLPMQGILAIRNSITVGGVTISEVRGLAVVLSRSPLVLVTGKELLQVGTEYPEEITGAVSSVICSYSTPVLGMGGGMGFGGGGFGMGPAGGAQSDFVLEPQPLIVSGDDSDLLYIFATATKQQHFFSTARLAKNPQPTGDWIKWAWLENAFLEILKENVNASPVATIAPDGSVALIVDGKIYGRDAIMKEYLQVYNSQVRDREPFQSDDTNPFSDGPAGFGPNSLAIPTNQAAAVAPADAFSTNRSLAARPDTPSYPERNARQGTRAASPRAALPNEWLASPSGQSFLPSTYQAQRLDAPNPRSDRIINAVVEAKKADDEAQAAKARSQLRELLEIEFDAQRTQKATELESLRQRIQQLEEAEEELKGQRDQVIEQRLNRLLGKPAR